MSRPAPAKIAGDWEGGYRLEWEYRPAASSFLNQFNDNNQERVNSTSQDIVVRWSQMYLANNIANFPALAGP
jgi:hypothetical protein